MVLTNFFIIIIIIDSLRKSFVRHRPSPVVRLGRLWAISYHAGPVRVGRSPFSRLLRHAVTYVRSILFMSPCPQGTWFQVFGWLLMLGLYSMIGSTRKFKLLPAVIVQAVVTDRKHPHNFNMPENWGGDTNFFTGPYGGWFSNIFCRAVIHLLFLPIHINCYFSFCAKTSFRSFPIILLQFTSF